MSKIIHALLFASASLFASLAFALPVYPVEVVAEFPHDRSAFTQGIVWHDGRLFESTGLYGRSTLREVEFETGRVLRKSFLDYREFGEGLTVSDGKLVQLTWRNGRAHIHDPATLDRLGTLRYDGEGWGLTGDGTHLYMSDGSATIRVLDPADFSVVRRIQVSAAGEPLDMLNAMQWVEGRIFVNVWQTTRIAIVDPESGAVDAFVDLTPLFERLDFQPNLADESPNGIAFDADGRRLFVTGKLWPKLFQIRYRDADGNMQP
jgi:glutaminyl-peptide cyclotransferase